MTLDVSLRFDEFVPFIIILIALALTVLSSLITGTVMDGKNLLSFHLLVILINEIFKLLYYLDAVICFSII
jgi:hypothetical protein